MYELFGNRKKVVGVNFFGTIVVVGVGKLSRRKEGNPSY
jgi:hypothetical protein